MLYAARHLWPFILLFPLFAEQRGQVSGMVQDSSGGALGDASVTVINYDTGIRRSAHTSPSGDYTIGALPPGNYKVTSRKAGFQTVARLDIRVTEGETTNVDFSMYVGSMREVITIRGAPPDMNTEDAAAGTRIARDTSDALPATGRGLLEVAQLAPGVVSTPAAQGEAGQFSVNGQRANANYFSVDGVSGNSGVTGGATPAQFSGGTLPAMTALGSLSTLAPDDDIDEVHIQTSGFAPEFGHTPGAQMQITTRSGTNEIHGALSAAGRSQTFDANDWLNNRASLGRSPAAFFDAGAMAGGPLRRDRTFAFASFETMRLDSPFTEEEAVPSVASRASGPLRLQPVLRAFPSPNGPLLSGGGALLIESASQPARFLAATVRVDHALTARVSLFARYQFTPSSAETGFAQIDHSRFRNQSVTVGSSALISPNISNDLRFNLARATVESSWMDTGQGGAQPADLTSIFGTSTPTATNLYGFAIGGIGQILSGEASHSRQSQWEAADTMSWTHSAHNIRLGVDQILLTPSRDQLASTIAGSYATLTALLVNGPMTVSQSQAAAASSHIEAMALFAQDTWRIGSRLTLNYGARWEITPAPSHEPATSSWPLRFTQVAPRVGLAWQAMRATVLRAGWGTFYNTEFAAATDPINAFPFNRWQFGIQSGALPIAPLSSLSTGPGVGANLRLPFANEWNVAIDHEFGRNDVLTASYVGSEGRRLLRWEAAAGGIDALAVSPVATNNGHSNFHALELHYRRKLSPGIEGLASYTWSHSVDNGSWDSGTFLAGSGNADHGPAAFDVRHNFSSGLIWRRRGWLLSGLVSARTGFPIDVLASENVLGFGFDDSPRPNLVGNVPVWIDDASVPGGRRLNPLAFAVPPRNQQGNLARNAIRGFGMAQLDVALEREFAVREGVLSLRLEAFNVLNHPQFADPVRFLDSPLFGLRPSMLDSMLGGGTPNSGLTPAFQQGGARVLQLGVRLRL